MPVPDRFDRRPRCSPALRSATVMGAPRRGRRPPRGGSVLCPAADRTSVTDCRFPRARARAEPLRGVSTPRDHPPRGEVSRRALSPSRNDRAAGEIAERRRHRRARISKSPHRALPIVSPWTPPHRPSRSPPYRDTEAIVYADLDLGVVPFSKYFAEGAGHYARPDVFSFGVDRTLREPLTAQRVTRLATPGAESPASSEDGAPARGEVLVATDRVWIRTTSPRSWGCPGAACTPCSPSGSVRSPPTSGHGGWSTPVRCCREGTRRVSSR